MNSIRLVVTDQSVDPQIGDSELNRIRALAQVGRDIEPEGPAALPLTMISATFFTSPRSMQVGLPLAIYALDVFLPQHHDGR